MKLINMNTKAPLVEFRGAECIFYDPDLKNCMEGEKGLNTALSKPECKYEKHPISLGEIFSQSLGLFELKLKPITL